MAEGARRPARRAARRGGARADRADGAPGAGARAAAPHRPPLERPHDPRGDERLVRRPPPRRPARHAHGRRLGARRADLVVAAARAQPPEPRPGAAPLGLRARRRVPGRGARRRGPGPGLAVPRRGAEPARLGAAAAGGGARRAARRTRQRFRPTGRRGVAQPRRRPGRGGVPGLAATHLRRGPLPGRGGPRGRRPRRLGHGGLADPRRAGPLPDPGRPRAAGARTARRPARGRRRSCARAGSPRCRTGSRSSAATRPSSCPCRARRCWS